MELTIEFAKFILYSILIVLISKYILVKILRNIAKLLKLRPKTVGYIAGVSTSIPELLTVSFSAFTGLIGTSIYNVLSSNIINTVQYFISIILNKNQRELKNTAIKVDLGLVLFTILIPVFMIYLDLENQDWIVIIFLILFFVFYKVSNNAHKVYIYNKDKRVKIKEKENEIIGQLIKEDEEKNEIDTKMISIEKYTKKTFVYVFWQGILLILVGILLYLIGNYLSEVLNELCKSFNIPQWILGILLGIITSLPELITFFESQKHHQEDKEGVIEATSNLFTSNIVNLFIIQTIGILIFLRI